MSNDNWHLSKSVPLTLIFGLFVQGAAIVWTVSTMTSDIEVNASKIVEVQQRLGRLEDAVHGQAVSMARIDENIKSIRMLVEKMVDKN
jgi:type VI protein secretion system component VasK